MRLIGDDGEQLGVVDVRDAHRLARERELDLVEVSATSVPPVCRLLDYGKYRYEQGKKEREARRGQKKVSLLREVRVRARINEHDLEGKIKLTKRLLAEGDKVKVSMIFRGREISHPERGRDIFRKMLEELKEVALVDQPQVSERSLVMVLSPAKDIKKDTKKEAEKPVVQKTPEETPKEEEVTSAEDQDA